jgi:hypothetical protein
MSKPLVTLRKSLKDKGLLSHVLKGDSWEPWRVLLIAAMGEALTADERVIFNKLTGRNRESGTRVSELEIVAGRRGGKTRALAALATYLASLVDYKDVLISGETGVLLCLAQDQRVATKILDFCEEDFNASPVLKQLVVSRSSDTFELRNHINIEVRPASFKKVRGPTYVGCICDELAFWFTEEFYANPDIEVIAAVTPGLLTTRGPVIMASSPYARRGVLWDTYKQHFGPQGSPAILVAKGTTRDFNPTIEQSEIDRLLAKDPARNRAEYLAEFRTDIEAFVSLDVVNACVERGVFERAPQPRHGIEYMAFADPSGGSVDSFTLAVGHYDHPKQTVVVDCLREVTAPFSTEKGVEDLTATLRDYNVHVIVGDKYAGSWPSEAFIRFNITYEPSAAPKSDLYRDLIPYLNSQRIQLLDHPKLIGQLTSLERRVARGGKDSIDHPPGAHDDLANAVAGLCAMLRETAMGDDWSIAYGEPTTAEAKEKAAKDWRQARLRNYIAAVTGAPWGSF